MGWVSVHGLRVILHVPAYEVRLVVVTRAHLTAVCSAGVVSLSNRVLEWLEIFAWVSFGHFWLLAPPILRSPALREAQTLLEQMLFARL